MTHSLTDGGGRRTLHAWILIAALILLQFLLFRQQLVREILWSYPANHDQVNFLQLSQETQHHMLTDGFWKGVGVTLRSPKPSSFMLPIQGGLVYYFLGPQRINALMLVFAYFALLQVVLAFSVHRLTGRWSASFIALGLLIGTSSRFFFAGGLADFRADGIASYLYGVTLCCFLLSDWLTDLYWSRITILSAALLCWFRPIAGVYLAASHLLLVGYLLFRIRRASDDPWARQLLRDLRKYGLMLAALTLPMLVLGARIFYDYYVFGHLLSPEKKIRALEQGVVTLTDNLLYYPRTLKDFHLGPPVIYVWVFLLAAAALLVGLGRRQYPTAQAKPERLAPSPASLGLIGIWIVSPLAILTMNLSKSPVVASIVVAPAVLWGALLLHRVLAALPSSAAFRGAGTALGVVSVVTGMTFMANYESRPSEQSAHAAQIQGLMKAYDDIAVYCRYYGLEKPNFATDRILEYFNGTAAAVMVFERSGLRILPRELLAYTIFARQADEAIGTAADADIALVTLDPVEKTKESLFPFHHSAVQWQTGYRDAVFSRMAPIARLNMPGHSFQIFLRPRATLEGETDGWLTAEGVVIAAPARALRVLPVIRLSGSTIGSKYLKGALGTIATLASERDGPATSTIPSKSAIHADESYEIEIDTAGIKLPDSGTVRLHLSFERYFIPRDLGINADPRKLVVQTPKSTTLSRQAGAAAVAAPQLTVGDLYP